jgi:glutathione peroxidase
MRHFIAAISMLYTASFALAGMPNVSFPSIEGGTLEMSDWDGRPVLVVNTASQCAFTRQYDELQTLYDTYREQGLVVLAVPSDDFRQELDSAAEVKDFCEINFGLDMPMTDITRVKGKNAHALYRAVKAETGFVPRWNFNKVLFAPDGSVAATWESHTSPMSRDITSAVEKALSNQE